MTSRTTQHRVDALLHTPDAAPWSPAPAQLHDRVMSALDAAPAQHIESLRPALPGAKLFALAAVVAIAAGGLGLFVGASAWRTSPEPALALNPADSPLINSPSLDPATEAPTVVLARAFSDFTPGGSSSRFVASVTAPMQTEAQVLVAETRLAARTVLSRLPFVSME